MAEPRVTPPRGTRESSLPVLDRFAPAPPEDQVRRWIGARSSGSDIVVELHGRGGWITRAAAEDLRRGYDLESTALTRLVAELVLRPPDLRHLDAAFTAFADQQRGGLTLRDSIERYQGMIDRLERRRDQLQQRLGTPTTPAAPAAGTTNATATNSADTATR